MTQRQPYNPLDLEQLGESIERALLEDSVCGPMPPAKFNGSGIYAIFYQGRFEPYAGISDDTCSVPIYIGKAMPKGGRKGEPRGGSGAPLFNRLRQHAKSIDQAENLNLDDFRCRYLVTDYIWTALGEGVAIRKLKPLWNSGPVEGFGNHAPGSGRAAMERPAWDILHPGRAWAAVLRPIRTPIEVAEEVREFIAGRLPPKDPTADEEEADPITEVG